MEQTPEVLVLGAGINGCAVARELALNGISTCVIDAFDIATGATAKSSRLIHGGLRYLEYGEFDLVRESLAERGRLLRLAPQFVQSLELFLPVRARFGGFGASLRRFLGRAPSKHVPRGLWLARIGLWLYDRYARDRSFPRHSVHGIGAPGVPTVNRAEYRWLCSYYDAQMVYPERFALALLRDARQFASARGVDFKVLTYCRTALANRAGSFRVTNAAGGEVSTIRPKIVVNATGAWGDATLRQLGASGPPLLGGTKGSHFITRNRSLLDAMASKAIYAEASDGRLAFLLPFDDSVLVGTTDLPFDQSPEQAVATRAELDYLIELVNHLFPDIRLTADDIELHYSGVRPLPYSRGTSASAITRRHWVADGQVAAVPVYTLVGGKLTVCRSLAEQTTDKILTVLGRPRIESTRDQLVSGAEGFPRDDAERERLWDSYVGTLGLSLEQIAALWPLLGTYLSYVVSGNASPSAKAGLSSPAGQEELRAPGGPVPGERQTLAGTNLPVEAVRWIIDNEWVERLEDLIERRLMLLYHPLTVETLRHLAALLKQSDRFCDGDADRWVQSSIERLHRNYGKRIDSANLPTTSA